MPRDAPRFAGIRRALVQIQSLVCVDCMPFQEGTPAPPEALCQTPPTPLQALQAPR